MEVVSKIFKIFCNVLTTIIAIMLLVTIYAWMQINLFNKEYASIFGYSMFDVVTGSMSGTIEIDDYVVVKNTKDVKLNDIVTFKDNNTLVTHRIVEMVGDKITTKGDSNNTNDYSITSDDIVGKVVLVLPKAGIWKNVFTDPRVLGGVLITLVFFTVFFSVEEKKYRQVKRVANLDVFVKKEDNNKNVKKEKKVVKANLDNLK